jgi:hypothetical protein
VTTTSSPPLDRPAPVVERFALAVMRMQTSSQEDTSGLVPPAEPYNNKDQLSGECDPSSGEGVLSVKPTELAEANRKTPTLEIPNVPFLMTGMTDRENARTQDDTPTGALDTFAHPARAPAAYKEHTIGRHDSTARMREPSAAAERFSLAWLSTAITGVTVLGLLAFWAGQQSPGRGERQLNDVDASDRAHVSSAETPSLPGVEGSQLGGAKALKGGSDSRPPAKMPEVGRSREPETVSIAADPLALSTSFDQTRSNMDFQETLDRERANAEILARDLTYAGLEKEALRAEHARAQSESVAKIKKLQEALDGERKRAELLERDLTAALDAQAADVAANRDSIKPSRSRAKGAKASRGRANRTPPLE